MQYMMPVIGALIGLVTNHIAIVMLFRPYKSIKIGGVKVFGEGVIPKNKAKLARKIGETVQNDLLQPQDFVKRINSKEVESFIEQSSAKIIDDILNRDIPSLNEFIPDCENELKVVSNLICDKICSFLATDKGRDMLTELTNIVLEKIGEKSFSELVSGKVEAQITSRILNMVILNSDKSKIDQFIWDSLQPELDEMFASEKSISDLSGEQWESVTDSAIHSISVILAQRVPDFLENEELSNAIKDILTDRIKESIKSNPQLSLFSSFISDQMLNDILGPTLEQIMPELSQYLQSESVQEIISHGIRKQFSTLITTPVNNLVNTFTQDPNALKKALLTTISDKTIYLITDKRVMSGLNDWLHTLFSMKINDLADVDNFVDISGMIVENLQKSLTGDDGKSRLNKAISGLLTYLSTQQLGKISTYVSGGILEVIHRTVHRFIMDILNKEFPVILKQINLEKIVEEKIIEFPLIKLEQIIRNVASKELKYITVFGGILGFAIGFIQMLLTL